jgi:hypothetical protein
MGSTKLNRNLTRRASSSADTSTRSASATTGISSIRIVSKRMRAGTLPVSAHNRDKGSGIPSDDGERNAATPIVSTKNQQCIFDGDDNEQ